MTYKKNYRLQMFGLPVIDNIQDLSNNTHLSKDLIYRLSKFNDKYYKIFDIAKRNGGQRKIYCPSKEMKAIQAWILRNILDCIEVSNYVTGFIKEKNIADNLKPHVGNKFILGLDIENFFPTITYGKVYNVFKTIGYNLHIAHVLTSICTCSGILPQGGVTSPALSNITSIRMDNRISGFVGKRNITYTRFADDMSFSSLSIKKLCSIRPFVKRIIREEGFSINHAKTRIKGPQVQRKITGLVLSDGAFGVGRKKKRILRAKMHKLLTQNINDEEKNKLEHHIDGWLAFLKSVDSSGYVQVRKYYSDLSAKVGKS